MLTAVGLSVSFGSRTVLKGVDVKLESGDQAAVVGRSGSGKTTLLLVLAGLLEPDVGSVERQADPDRVMYLPQAPSLVPELTARQNASAGLRIRGAAPAHAEQMADHYLDLLGLTGCADSLPSELSGGMQQRVALARALAVDPTLLLADEPTGALDQATGAMVLDVLSRHAERTGLTLVVATHDERVAQRLPRRLTFAAEPVS